MPNHVTNKVEITSTNAAEALAFIKGDDSAFDFNKIIPMPESLDIESGSLTDFALAYALTNGEKKNHSNEQIEKYFEDDLFDPKSEIARRDLERAHQYVGDSQESREKLLELGQKVISNVDTYGHKTWYSWRTENWGTKWNAYEVTTTENSIEFDTAWDSPTPVLEKWIEQFKLTCTVKAFDEGYNFWFIKEYKDGALHSERYKSPEDRDALAVELKGYSSDEESDEE
ncbi:hypothetical protein [Acinetobacter baumannii]|uniref:DUF1281 family ferredoxin-like fold protein n=1 Tax=Acinetobacter baumannii TaxID=470 RepID=UPI003F642D74